MGEAGSFAGDALEDVVHERVHDAHGFAGDSSVGVNLFQHLVDVDSIAFLSLSLSSLLYSISRRFGGLSGFLLAFLSSYLWCHFLNKIATVCCNRTRSLFIVTVQRIN